jgi:hypothetical protein
MVDNTDLGLRPLVGQTNQDNLICLETSIHHPGQDFVFVTFQGPSFTGNTANIFRLGTNATSFNRTNLLPFATAAQMGLTSGDIIDALALSDVSPGSSPGSHHMLRNGTLNVQLDEALFSLAAGSPSLASGGFSAADVFYTSFGGSNSVFARAADLGLLPQDDVDAIDIGPVPPDRAEQAVVISEAAASNGVFYLSFVAEAGICYTIESTENLNAGIWRFFQAVQGNGARIILNDTAVGPERRFYRIRTD